MKQYTLELFGYCLAFLGPLAVRWSGGEPITPRNAGSCPDDRHETRSDRRRDAEHLVQIGAVVLDYCANQPEAEAPGGRLPPGPARIIASIG